MFKQGSTSTHGPSKKRSAAEGVGRAFTVATQMALISPAGVDEWVSRELGGDRVHPPSRRLSR
jgi:hypothetical protein